MLSMQESVILLNQVPGHLDKVTGFFPPKFLHMVAKTTKEKLFHDSMKTNLHIYLKKTEHIESIYAHMHTHSYDIYIYIFLHMFLEKPVEIICNLYPENPHAGVQRIHHHSPCRGRTWRALPTTCWSSKIWKAHDIPQEQAQNQWMPKSLETPTLAFEQPRNFPALLNKLRRWRHLWAFSGSILLALQELLRNPLWHGCSRKRASGTE